MSISRIPSSPEAILSRKALGKFFHNSPDLEKVKKQAQKTPYQYSKDFVLIAPIKYLVYSVSGFSFMLIAALSKCIGAKNLELRIQIWSDHCMDVMLEIFQTSQQDEELLV